MIRHDGPVLGRVEVRSTYTEILPILGDIGEVTLCVTSIEP